MLNSFQQGEDIMRRKELEQVRLIVKLLNMLRGMKGMEPLSYKEEIWKKRAWNGKKRQHKNRLLTFRKGLKNKPDII